MIELDCSCGHVFTVDEATAGRVVECPRCGRQVRPSERSSAQPATTSRAAIASLVLGLLSCGICLFSLPAAVLGIVGLVNISSAKGRVTGAWLAVLGLILALVGPIVSLVLYYFIGVALDVKPLAVVHQNADRQRSQNNLKQMGLAMHNHESSHGQLPPAIIPGPDGKPYQSWRVLLLPYLEQDAMFMQMDMTQPWDGPPNSQHLARMPRLYAPLGKKAGGPPNMTFYQAFYGPEAALDEAHSTVVNGRVVAWQSKTRFAAVADGLSNTIVYVEAGESVPWMKPQDLRYDPKKPLPRLGEMFTGGFNATFADGSVRFLSNDIDEKVLRALITRNGAEELPPDYLIGR